MSTVDMEKKTEIKNPVTGERLDYSKVHSEEELKVMVENAKVAQEEWSRLKIKERVKYLRPIRDYLVSNSDKLADVISKDNGKTHIDALLTEIITSAMAISYYSKKAHGFLKSKKLGMGNILFLNKRSKCVWVPYGVVGIITPWNYPFTIPFSEVIMALLAGNSVILKVASETQGVGLALKECIESAKLPENVFNYLNMPGRIAGDALLANGINKLFLTGSVPVGKKMMAKASETLTPVNLELGGNDAMIVCADADPYRAAVGVTWAGFSNAGQSCGGVERIYVHKDIYDSFMSILKVKTESLKVGYDIDYSMDIGAITTEKQRNTIKHHIDEALSKGAKIFARSKVINDNKSNSFLPAVVLTNLNHDMTVMREETFGPVVGVMKVDNIDEAIKLANDSCLGLTGSVWSKNRKNAERIGKQIKAGAITINDHLMSHGLAETAWGGFKESGIGRSHGIFGFSEMIQPQMIVHDILPGVKKNLWWHPYNKKLYNSLGGIMDMLYGKGLLKKLAGTLRLLKVLPRIFIK